MAHRTSPRLLATLFALLVSTLAAAPLALAQPEPLVPPGDPVTAPTDPVEATVSRSRVDVEAVQGLLAVQHLDAWLLSDDSGQNPIAQELVNPDGAPSRRWFYLIPAKGQPIALVHNAEIGGFEAVPGRKLEYAGYRDLAKGLRALLKGVKTVAMEYSAKGEVSELSRVDAGTIELVKAQGVSIRSSAELVQFTKSLWGPDGRKNQYVAAHHITELRKEAFAWIAKQLTAGIAVTEHDVAKRITRGFTVRGLVGPTPVVAAGVNTADPQYVPSAKKSAIIKKDDLIIISLAARLDDDAAGGKRSIYAAHTWVAFAGGKVPERILTAFDLAGYGRDEGLTLIRDRLKRRRAVKGFEVDQAARGAIGKAGFADNFLHRTGHSIDTDVAGAGANLDDYEAHDVRNLVLGSGFTVGPGLYFKGEFGVRAEVTAYVGTIGLEVTTPLQDQIELLFPPPPSATPPAADATPAIP
jgi:Xaa-Pro dipeptidase